MICPGCSTQNQDDFKFCRECGRRLAAVAPAAGEPTVAAFTNAPAGAASASAAASVDETVQAGRLLDHAFDLYDESNYEEALGACQAALALDPSGSTAHSLLGMIYERLGKTGEAVQQYQIVLRMNPDSVADATRLDALLGRRVGSRVVTAFPAWLQGRRLPAVIAAAVAAVVLVAGLWATVRAVGQGEDARRGATSRTVGGQVPGASMPRPPAPTQGMPGAEEALASPQRGARWPAPTHPAPGAAQWPAAGLPSASVPSPPPANAWPGLRGAYPAAPPLVRAPQTAYNGVPGARLPASQRYARRWDRPDANGFLPPAPIQGVEKLNPNAPAGLSQVPGAGLPAFPGAAPAARGAARSGRGPAPVLPSVTAGNDQRPPAVVYPPQTPPAAAPQPPPAAAPQPPPSASISIQPLEEQEQPADATRGARQYVAPQPGGVSLGEALQHQQMAAYYRRQGDHQAAYDEYQYARDLFRSVQQRGGRDAAVAAQGAVAAQYGMSRLQAP